MTSTNALTGHDARCSCLGCSGVVGADVDTTRYAVSVEYVASGNVHNLGSAHRTRQAGIDTLDHYAADMDTELTSVVRAGDTWTCQLTSLTDRALIAIASVHAV